MDGNVLKSMSMEKYESLLSKIFPEATAFALSDRQQKNHWQCIVGDEHDDELPAGTPKGSWTEYSNGIERRQLSAGNIEFRRAIQLGSNDSAGWLVVTFDARQSTPLHIAPELLGQAFGSAIKFLTDEAQLHIECDQLAVELTERYEELNLVYSTKDQVEYFEEGQEALTRLVSNCADYLDVEMAALICDEHHLALHSADPSASTTAVREILTLLASGIYDKIQSRIEAVVLNETDSEERRKLFSGRDENLIAYPIVDDYGAAIGLLAVVARGGSHTFSNGDRNLLEVMAKKASRIIHTHHDSLTGLMNRSGFESSIVTTHLAARANNLHYCLLHVDIDQLHLVNDLLGPAEGDNVIRRVAKTLTGSVRGSDIVARLGGNSFSALLGNCTVKQGRKIADNVRDAVRNLTVAAATRRLDVSVSVGLAALDRESDSVVGVMAAAEIACKAAKEAGRDRTEVFEKDNTALVQRSEEVEWIARIQQALRDDALVPFCQPVMPLDEKNHAAHFEILIRMRASDGEILLPGSFLPAAERYQLMPMLDRWVVHHSLRTLGLAWNDVSAGSPVFCLNLSGQSLTNNGFLAFVIDEVEQSGIPPENLCFEVTETAAISNIDEATAFMADLKELGCKFSLDDFGAGLSSFGYLKQLPVDYLKIDGSFVKDMATDPVSLSLVTAIHQIGRTMGLLTVAEYVENREIAELLRGIGVDYLQGFGIGKPVPLEKIIIGLINDANAMTITA